MSGNVFCSEVKYSSRIRSFGFVSNLNKCIQRLSKDSFTFSLPKPHRDHLEVPVSNASSSTAIFTVLTDRVGLFKVVLLWRSIAYGALARLLTRTNAVEDVCGFQYR